jgi:hypothetical protein
MGIYLPMELTVLIPIGAFIAHYYDRWADRQGNPAFSRRMGVLAATGLIVGESLFGVAFAGIVAVTGRETPLAVVGDSFTNGGIVLGLVLFTAVTAALYRAARRI